MINYGTIVPAVLQSKEMVLPQGMQPEQMGVFNPLAVMLLIPIFEKYGYPMMARVFGEFARLTFFSFLLFSFRLAKLNSTPELQRATPCRPS